jgi:serine/threonine protein kinase
MNIELKCPTCGALSLSTASDNSEPLPRTITDNPPEEALEATIRSASAEDFPNSSGFPDTAQTADSETSREQFGNYELLEEIAHGGMGMVFRAPQVGLDRTVALKMVLAERLGSEADRKRFLIEAQAAAKLQHPNIVAVHEVGDVRGQHFYSMDYVAGQTLAQMVREHPLPARQAARYLQKTANAIHYAHLQGVLHRDIKPGNVLIDGNDEPRVMDFGLAKLLNDDSQQTLSGTIMGTPSYMSLEQATGQIENVDARSDVYSLGAVLYELLTGSPPFRGETAYATLKLLAEKDAVPPRQINPKIPPDLQTICLKALEKQPAGRYPDAGSFAEDLRRFLADEPITARPTGMGGKLWRWCRRKPLVAASRSRACCFWL